MRIDINTNIININTTITNDDIARYLNSFDSENQLKYFEKALDVGCAILQRIETKSDIDYVDRRIASVIETVNLRFLDLASKLEETLSLNLNPSNSNSFLSKAKDIIIADVTKLNNGLNTLLANVHASLDNSTKALDTKMNPDTKTGYLGTLIGVIEEFDRGLNTQFNVSDSASFVGKLNNSITEHFGADGTTISAIKDVLRVDADGQTPLGKIYRGLKSEIQGLRDLIMKIVGQQEIVEQTTIKGFSFEDVVFDKLQAIAKPYSDIVKDVSTKSEYISGSKKGDYIYTIAENNVPIVIDAKNYDKLNSLPAMLSYIEQAMTDRNAKIGVIVVPEIKNLQRQIGEWNIYDGNKIITPLASLEISIKYARCLLRITNEVSEQINLGLVRDKLDTVLLKLKEMTVIKTKLTKLSNGIVASINEIREDMDKMRDGINEQLQVIETELAAK